MKKFIFMEFCKCYVKALQNVNCCYNNHSNEKIGKLVLNISFFQSYGYS